MEVRSRIETRYDLFYGTIHLNAKGRRVLTEDLAARLKELL